MIERCLEVAHRSPWWPHHEWLCVLARDHQGDHRPSDEAELVPIPLADMPRDRLVAEAQLMADQIVTARRERDATLAATAAVDAARDGVVAHLLRSGGGRSAKHDPTCFVRHVACLARLINWGQWVDMAAALMASAKREQLNG